MNKKLILQLLLVLPFVGISCIKGVSAIIDSVQPTSSPSAWFPDTKSYIYNNSNKAIYAIHNTIKSINIYLQPHEKKNVPEGEYRITDSASVWAQETTIIVHQNQTHTITIQQ